MQSVAAHLYRGRCGLWWEQSRLVRRYNHQIYPHCIRALSSKPPPVTLESLQNQPLLNVAIVGPPNAGKSTLFNRFLDKSVNRAYTLKSDRKVSGRILRKPKANSGGAIVSNVPGTTRDRRECIGRLGDVYFRLVDTAGIDIDRIQAGTVARIPKDRLKTVENISNSNNDTVGLRKQMLQQTLQAAQQAELILLMFDAKIGITTDFTESCEWLRRIPQNDSKNLIDRHIVLLANKLEGDAAWNFEGSVELENIDRARQISLGQKDNDDNVIAISALHGDGLAEIAVIVDRLSKEKQKILAERGIVAKSVNDDVEKEKPLQLAILGRPNVGKSTLVNALLQQNRVLVGPTPGLTRDAISVDWMWKNEHPVKLVDTAGIRKQSKAYQEFALNKNSSNYNNVNLEDFAVQDAIRALKVADVAVLVIDADARMLQRQELVIAKTVIEEGRALVVAVNKMDLVVDKKRRKKPVEEEAEQVVEETTSVMSPELEKLLKKDKEKKVEPYTKQNLAADVQKQLEDVFPALRQTPVVPMCAKTGENVTKLMPVVFETRERWSQTVSTSQLNKWIADVQQRNTQEIVRGRQDSVPVKIKYMIQSKGRPPTFILFCNTDSLSDSYVRFLRKNFQDTFNMYGMEVRLIVKKSTSTGDRRSVAKRQKGSYKQGYKRDTTKLQGVGGKENRRKRRITEQRRTRIVREKARTK